MVHIKPAFHCAKNKQVFGARAVFARMALGGRWLNIGWKVTLKCKPGHVFRSQAREYTFTLCVHGNKLTRRKNFLKDSVRKCLMLKVLQKSLIIELFHSTRIWFKYGLFTFVQLYIYSNLKIKSLWYQR